MVLEMLGGMGWELSWVARDCPLHSHSGEESCWRERTLLKIAILAFSRDCVACYCAMHTHFIHSIVAIGGG